MGWNWLKELFRQPGVEMGVVWLSDETTPQSGEGHYVHVRMADMHLGRSRDWGRDRLPVLQSVITSPRNAVEIPYTISPDAFSDIGDGRFRWSEDRNLPLSGPIPFDEDAGELRLVVGLLQVGGGGLLSTTASFLGELSQLVQVPQLSAAAGISSKISDGAERLISVLDPAGILALQTSIRYDELRSGYLLCLGAQDGAYQDSQFSVDQKSHALRLDGNSVSDEELDYLLLRVIVSDDAGRSWEQIPTIYDPYTAMLTEDDLAKAQALALAAMRAARTCPDLTFGDRKRVPEEIKKEFLERPDMPLPDANMRALLDVTDLAL